MIQQQELIPMATGEALKQRRLRKKLSLENVAKAIKLDEKVLADIEEDRADRITGIYRNGYIKSYARHLGFEQDEIDAMLETIQIGQPELKNIFSNAPRRNTADSWLRAASYVLASLLIGTLAWQFTHEAVRLSQGGSPLQKTAGEPSDQPPAVRGPVNASIATLGALHGKQSRGQDPAEQAWEALSQPKLADGESRLVLRFSADSWVEITDADGRELEMDLLRGGSEKTYQGRPPFKMLIGRASAVHVSMDGEQVDLAAHTVDDVAQFSWPRIVQAQNTGPNDD